MRRTFLGQSARGGGNARLLRGPAAADCSRLNRIPGSQRRRWLGRTIYSGDRIDLFCENGEDAKQRVK